MGSDQFEQEVRQFRYRQPFQPFVAELMDGTSIEVRSPKFVVGGGGIAWLDLDDERLIEINSENVRELRPVNRETAA